MYKKRKIYLRRRRKDEAKKARGGGVNNRNPRHDLLVYMHVPLRGMQNNRKSPNLPVQKFFLRSF